MMKDIDASSATVGEIARIMEDIAFQATIRALNAAVEAGEVRSLAQRSASASLQDQTLQLEQAMALFKLERRRGQATPLRAPERRATAGALTAP